MTALRRTGPREVKKPAMSVRKRLEEQKIVPASCWIRRQVARMARTEGLDWQSVLCGLLMSWTPSSPTQGMTRIDS